MKRLSAALVLLLMLTMIPACTGEDFKVNAWKSLKSVSVLANTATDINTDLYKDNTINLEQATEVADKIASVRTTYDAAVIVYKNVLIPVLDDPNATEFEKRSAGEKFLKVLQALWDDADDIVNVIRRVGGNRAVEALTFFKF